MAQSDRAWMVYLPGIKSQAPDEFDEFDEFIS